MSPLRGENMSLAPSGHTCNSSLLTGRRSLVTGYRLKKLLRLIEPAFFRTILVGGRGLDGLYASLHGAGGFALVAEPCMRASHQVEPFGIVRTIFEKALKDIARVVELSCRQ